MNTLATWARKNLLGLGDSEETITVRPLSRLQFDGSGNGHTVSLLSSLTYFELLPVVTTVVATSEKLCLLIGTNTPVAAQSTTGGLKLTTGATNTNQAGVGGIAATGFTAPITATNGITFRTRVSVASLLTMLASAGLNQNPTDIDPTATAGEGCTFVFDPTNSMVAATAATAAQALNIILASKVAGADTFIFTNVPIVANQDYDLAIQLNADLTASYYVNTVLVGTSPALATANATLAVLAGVRTLANTAAAMNVRFAQLARLIG